MATPELESYFQKLTDITDNIAIINTHYEADHESDFRALESFFADVVSHNWEESEPKYFDLFASYFTFHIKIVEEIIREAREILNPDKRTYLKQLVNYQKSASDWFTSLKKKRKSNKAA